MAHIGIKRLRTGNGQEHRPKNNRADNAMIEQEIQRVDGVEGVENLRVIGDMIKAERCERQKPDHHDRPKIGGDFGCAPALHGE